MPDDIRWRSHSIQFGIRRQLRAMGYFPVPACGKAVFLPNWREAAKTAGEDDFRRWETAFEYSDPKTGELKTYKGERHANTGIALGENLLALDVDVPVARIAKRIEDLAAAVVGPTPRRRIGMAPKVLLLYRADTKRKKDETDELLLPDRDAGKAVVTVGKDDKHDGIKAQVEVLRDGQQFIAFGVHPDAGTEYTWSELGPDVVPAHELPVAMATAVEEFLARAARISPERRRTHPGGVARVPTWARPGVGRGEERQGGKHGAHGQHRAGARLRPGSGKNLGQAAWLSRADRPG